MYWENTCETFQNRELENFKMEAKKLFVNGNVADLILTQLSEWGVERIYGVLGDSLFPLLDAISRQDRIKFIPAAQEANAAFMASSEASLTGRLTVCAASAGPGSACLINGLACARLDRNPVLAITGQVETKDMRTGTKQYFDQAAVFSFFTGFTALLVEPRSALDTLAAAAGKAYRDSTAVHVSIPKDVFSGQAQAETIPEQAVEMKSLPVVSGGIESVLDVLRRSKRPLIIAGKPARVVKEQVLSLCRRLETGFILALEAKGAIENGHELCLGGMGPAGVPPLLGEADCLFVIGDPAYEKEFFPCQASIVQISDHPASFQAGRLSVTGDLVLMLQSLEEGLHGRQTDAGWLEKIKALARNVKNTLLLDKGSYEKEPVNPLALMSALNGIIPSDAIICLDIGEFTHWFNRGFSGGNQLMLLSGMWRSLGYGLPAAIAAKLARPDKTVIAVLGDGGAIYSMSEILTCVRFNLPLTVIILKNNEYGLEKNKMIAEGFKPYGYDLVVPDFVQLAKSCGAEGLRVSKISDVRNIIGPALVMNRPVFIEVACEPGSLPAAGA